MSSAADDPEQGWRYDLAGVVGSPQVLVGIARALPAACVVELDVPGLALVPVTKEIADALTPAALCALELDVIPGGTQQAARQREDWLTGPESGFDILTPGVVALLEANSTLGPIGYLEASYLGRNGTQAAAVWRAGRLVCGPLLLGRRETFTPDVAPISIALRELGITAVGRRDEFVVAGLGRHRQTADWLEAASPSIALGDEL